MRVITGSARGRKLQAVEGLNTRPTTDRVKESIFNIIQFDIEGRAVLDLFAGSGQMGIECISRGAERCVFVDADKRAQQVIAANVATCGFQEQSRVIAGDALLALQQLANQPFGLILLDPPYGGKLLNQVLERIAQIDILQPGGIILCECAKEDSIVSPPPPYCLKKEYLYGAIRILTFTRGSDAQ